MAERRGGVNAAALSLVGACCPAVSTTSSATDAYLATLEAQGIAIYGVQYVVQLGQGVGIFVRRYPVINVVCLAMNDVTSEYDARPYDYAQARLIALAALGNLYPGVR